MNTEIYFDNRTNSVFVLTIAIPTFNRPISLEKCLKSILAFYNDNIEVVVVDNTQDEKLQLANIQVVSEFSQLQVVYYRNATNIGMFGNWNRCTQLSNGEFLTILNDDDLLLENFYNSFLFGRQILPNADYYIFGVMIEDKRQYAPRKPLFYGRILNRFFKTKKKSYQLIRGADYIFGNKNYGSLGAVIRRSTALDVSFDQSYAPASDVKFFMDLTQISLGARFQQVVSTYTVENNESMKKETIVASVSSLFNIRINYLSAHYSGPRLEALIFLLKIYHRWICYRQLSFWSGRKNTIYAYFLWPLMSSVRILGSRLL